MIGQREILINIVELMEEYKISYLLTGSFAVSYYGFPRATHDIDFVVEIHRGEKRKILVLLKRLGRGFDYDEKLVVRAIENFGQFDVFHFDSAVKIDFWIRKQDELERNKFKRSRVIKIGSKSISAVSAEDLILTKLVWCREVRSDRHLRDCVGIIKTQQKELDWKYLNFWAKKLEVTGFLAEVKESDYSSY